MPININIDKKYGITSYRIGYMRYDEKDVNLLFYRHHHRVLTLVVIALI